MQFKQGVGVRTIDGKSVGQLDGVVVDPRTKEVTYIIVRKGAFFTTDKVVPLNLVAAAEDEGVTLREHAGDLEALPDFEQRYYVPAGQVSAPGAPATAASAGIAAAPTLYPYPPVVGGETAGLGNVNAQGSIGAVTVQGPVVEQRERAIPDDSIALRPGARVISLDGQHVGSIEQVLTGNNADEVTHFVIAQGILFKDRKLIPIAWVSQFGEQEVYLALDAGFLEKLPAYSPPPAQRSA